MTSAKRSLPKRLHFCSDFVAVSPTRPTCHFSVNFPRIEFLETNTKFKKTEREIRRPKFASSLKRCIKRISPRTRAVKATKCTDKARRTCRVAVLLINLLTFCLSRRCRCRRCYGSIESGLERGGRGRKQANLVLARSFLSAFLDREQKFIKASFGWSICTNLFGDQVALRSIKTNVRLVSIYQNLFLSLKIQGWVNTTF